MRILYITRYFPPEISGGARRPSALVAALRRAGARVTLCAPEGVDDPDLIAVAHPTFPVGSLQSGIGKAASSVPPNAAAEFGNWLRRHLLLPDPEIRWALRVVKAVKASGRKFDWILTSSPPESLHVAGALLKQHLGIAWVCDVRDHWIETPQRRELNANPMRAGIERLIAKICFRRANALIGVSGYVLGEVAKYARPLTPCLELGHFAENYNGPKEALPQETLNLVHTGAIRLSNPLSEFAALLNDFETFAINRPEIVLWLAGVLDKDELASLEASPAKSRIRLLGQVTMERARALQYGADVLVLVSGRESTALPGKFAEYVQTKKPIVLSAVGPWTTLLPKNANIVSWGDMASIQKEGEKSDLNAVTHNAADAAADDLLRFLAASTFRQSDKE